MSIEPELVCRAAQLFYAYARCVDEGDLDLLDTLVADDVRIVRAEGESHGRDGVRALYTAYRDQGLQLSRHTVTNVQALRLPGGSIQARAYFTATMIASDDVCTQVFGQYADTLTDIGGDLLIQLKRVIVQRAVTLSTVGGRAWAGVDVPG